MDFIESLYLVLVQSYLLFDSWESLFVLGLEEGKCWLDATHEQRLTLGLLRFLLFYLPLLLFSQKKQLVLVVLYLVDHEVYLLSGLVLCLLQLTLNLINPVVKVHVWSPHWSVSWQQGHYVDSTPDTDLCKDVKWPFWENIDLIFNLLHVLERIRPECYNFKVQAHD